AGSRLNSRQRGNARSTTAARRDSPSMRAILMLAPPTSHPRIASTMTLPGPRRRIFVISCLCGPVEDGDTAGCRKAHAALRAWAPHRQIAGARGEGEGGDVLVERRADAQ